MKTGLARRVIALTAAAVTSALILPAPAANATFPGTNGRIAYVVDDGGVRAIDTVGPLGNDPEPLIHLDGRDAIEPAWSKDGSKIAFAAQAEPDGAFAIYTANADGSNLTQVTSGADDVHPAWSPDGSRLAFTRRTESGSRIFLLDLSDGSVQPLTDPADEAGSQADPAWSPDGTMIAYVFRMLDPQTCPDCRFDLRVIHVGARYPDGDVGYYGGPNLRDPDWSPDGRRIAATLDYGSGSAIFVFDTSPSLQLVDTLTDVAPLHDPSWSPHGDRIAYIEDSDAPFGPTLLSRTLDGQGILDFGLTGTIADAAWGPGETVPPDIELDLPQLHDGWIGGDGVVLIPYRITDDSGLDSASCWVDQRQLHLTFQRGIQQLWGDVNLYEQGRGIELGCTATDVPGNAAVRTFRFDVDLSPPQADAPVVNPSFLRVGDATSVSTTADDWLSGLAGGSLLLEADAQPPVSAPLTLSGSTLSGTVAPTEAGIYSVTVRPVDVAGNAGASSPAELVVVDPGGGSVGGTGWIVPEGTTSDPGDQLPGLDGSSKASVSFTAKYKSSDWATPDGGLNVTYDPGSFRLRSKTLDWLVVPNSVDVAHFQGLATIQGMDGLYPYRVTVTDGDPAGTPDHFLLEVFSSGADPAAAFPLFQASGDFGGQIKIQR
jgi:hypothetical protein